MIHTSDKQPTKFTKYRINESETFVVAIRSKDRFYWSRPISLQNVVDKQKKELELEKLTTNLLVDILARRNNGIESKGQNEAGIQETK